MLEEIYDVVDKNCKKIGTATWTQVHTKGFLHQTVHGIVFRDSRLNKTIIKRRTNSVPQEPGKYEISVAGHILSGQTPEETIKKELSEELFNNKDLPKDIVVKKIASYFNNDLSNNHEIAHLFVIIHAGPFTVQIEETNKLVWVSWKNLVEDMNNNPSKYAQYSINAVNIYVSHIKLSKKLFIG